MKTKHAALALLLAAPLLSGCVTVRNSKALVLTPQPGQSEMAVTADATARCYDVFLLMWCNLKLNMQQAK